MAMSIQLISISHKTAPLLVREKFAFSKDVQEDILMELYGSVFIEECVLVSTCNRTEVYTLCRENARERDIYEFVQGVLLRRAQVENQADIGNIFRFYGNEKAIHHLFLVASGLDSMVIGEDQILGQVKDAQNMAVKLGTCKTYLNTFFRYAITASKKVKTDTRLSKTPVSTAIICIRAAQSYLGTLDDKNIMIIGASGKIGSVVLKNLLSDYNANVFVTVRDLNSLNPGCVSGEPHGRTPNGYTRIPYDRRYEYLADMDVVISATSSPHYTLTYDSVEKHLVFGRNGEAVKRRAFMDLAVPLDIESRIGTLPGVLCSNIDDFGKTAKSNNEIKLREAKVAREILEEYETAFRKWMIFQISLPKMREVRNLIIQEAQNKGLQKALDKFFYRVRESADPKQLEVFMECLTPQQWEQVEKIRD